jgi:hypothetical protein
MLANAEAAHYKFIEPTLAIAETGEMMILTLRTALNLTVGLGIAMFVACNGARTEMLEERVPASTYPSQGGSSAGTAAGGSYGGANNQAGGARTTAHGQGGVSGGDDAGSDFDSGLPPELIGAPLISTPTQHGFGINVVLAGGNPAHLRAKVRASGNSPWVFADPPTSPAPDVAQFAVTNLEPGQRYEYAIIDADDDSASPLYVGSAVTQRAAGAAFTFAVTTDSHIEPPDAVYTGNSPELTLRQVAQDIGAAAPDFIINMGDMLDFHYFGFNAPVPDKSYVRGAYMRYRAAFGDTLGNAAHYPVIGNWEGEDGFFEPDQIALARSQRTTYVPAPTPTTYPEGGSSGQDYYAFTWGDALFVVLNVMSYTPTAHLLSGFPGLPDDWTLGSAQMSWLQQTLEQATSKWRFLFIHHTVGGKAGDDANSGYGRGGGQAAYVGEQATVHALMLQFGVQIFFYGHDHVFTDMNVDGIHYTLPGSSGAPWKFTSSETGYTSYWSDSGYGRVEVGPTAVDVQFVSSGGSVIYEYQLK